MTVDRQPERPVMFAGLVIEYDGIDVLGNARDQASRIREEFGFEAPGDGKGDSPRKVAFESGSTALTSCIVEEGSLDLVVALVEAYEWQGKPRGWVDDVRCFLELLGCDNVGGKCARLDILVRPPESLTDCRMVEAVFGNDPEKFERPRASHFDVQVAAQPGGSQPDGQVERRGIAAYVSDETSFVTAEWEDVPFPGVSQLIQLVKDRQVEARELTREPLTHLARAQQTGGQR